MSDVSKPPRIGIDGFNLAMPHGTGVATYARTLARVLQQHDWSTEGLFGIDAGRDPRLQEVMFFERLGRVDEPPTPRRRRSERRRAILTALRPRIRVTADHLPSSGRIEAAGLADRLPAFDRLATSPLLFEIAHKHFARYRRFVKVRMVDPPTIMHWTYPVPVELEGARNVYTIHDLVPLRLPFTTLESKPFYRDLLEGCIARASAIATVSEASREAILAEFGSPSAPVINTYQAAPLPPGFLDRSRDSDAQAIESMFGLSRDGYFLFLGAVEPKKNLGRLLEAYLSSNFAAPLVLAGGRSWQSERELSLLDQRDTSDTAHGQGLERRVVRLGHLSRNVLLQLVRGARAVVFPSIHEGFGLPVLEAMSLGTPVLTSDVAALREVAGSAAMLVDPYSVPSIAAGLLRLDNDPSYRDKLRVDGPRQAARFSSAAYFERLQAFYTAAMSH